MITDEQRQSAMKLLGSYVTISNDLIKIYFKYDDLQVEDPTVLVYEYDHYNKVATFTATSKEGNAVIVIKGSGPMDSYIAELSLHKSELEPPKDMPSNLVASHIADKIQYEILESMKIKIKRLI